MASECDHASAERYARPLAAPKHGDFPGLPSSDLLVNLARCYHEARTELAAATARAETATADRNRSEAQRGACLMEIDRLRAALETAHRRIASAIEICGEVETLADHPPCGAWDCMTCIHRPIIETLRGDHRKGDGDGVRERMGDDGE